MLVNPAAGRRGDASRFESLGRLAGLELRRTSSVEQLDAEVRRAAATNRERLLVAGGDGTLHVAVQGLAHSRCALGIVPTGSGNDLARSLGVPLDPEAAARRAMERPAREIDLGRVGRRLFAGVAGLGFHGEVAARAAAAHRFVRGPLIYPYAVLRALFRFSPPVVSVEHEQGRHDGRVLIVVVANVTCFGGGMRIAPRAVPDDGLLDLVIVERMSPLRTLAAFPRVYRGTHLSHPAVRSARVREVALRCDPALPLYGDGEPMFECGGPEGIRIEVAPRALRVVA